MKALKDFADLIPNANWSSLPLFDRSRWTRVRFGDVVENVNETEKSPADAGIDRFIAMEHLEPGSLHVRECGNVADGTTFTRRCRPGQVLFGKRRAYQRKVAVSEFDAVVSGDIYVLAPKDERLISELLPFLCLSERFFQHAVGTSAGSLSPRTNWSSLASFEFDLPPLDQQGRIAEILWQLDESTQAYNDLLGSLVKTREVTRSTLLAFGIGTHPLKSNEIGEVPEHWAVRSIAAICSEPIRDFGSFSSTKLIDFLDFGVAFLKSEMIGDFELHTADTTYISPEVHAVLQKSWVRPGDILYSKIGSALGKAVIYDGRFGTCNSNAAIAKLTVNEQEIRPLFLCHLLNATQIKRRMSARIVSLLPRLNLGDISSFQIPVPPLLEQDEILDRLENIRKTEGTLNLAVRSSNELRNAMTTSCF